MFEEFINRMVEAGGALHPSGVPANTAYNSFIDYGHDKVAPFDPECAKITALRMVREAGVDLLFHTLVVDTVTQPGKDGRRRVTGLVCASKSGLHLQPACMVIDCSADGDVAALAGNEIMMGRDQDGLMQPMTLFFRVQGIDDARVEDYVRSHPEEFRPFGAIVAKAREEGRFPVPRKGVGMYRTLQPGVWRINTGRVLKRDGTDVNDLTAAEIEGREQDLCAARVLSQRIARVRELLAARHGRADRRARDAARGWRLHAHAWRPAERPPVPRRHRAVRLSR